MPPAYPAATRKEVTNKNLRNLLRFLGFGAGVGGLPVAGLGGIEEGGDVCCFRGSSWGSLGAFSGGMTVEVEGAFGEAGGLGVPGFSTLADPGSTIFSGTLLSAKPRCRLDKYLA